MPKYEEYAGRKPLDIGSDEHQHPAHRRETQQKKSGTLDGSGTAINSPKK